MSRFIINDKIVFDENNSILISLSFNENVTEIKLDNLENIVLTTLVSNSKTLVSYEEFLGHWRSSEASENSLSRVISLLRSKLKKLGITDNLIINTPKKGYTFLGKVEKGYETSQVLKEEKERSSERIVVEEDTKKAYTAIFRPHQIWALVLILTLITVSIYIFDKVKSSDTQKPQSQLQEAKFVEILEDNNIKIEFDYNNESNNIVFSNLAEKDKYWRLKVIGRYYENPYILKEDSKHLRKAMWLNVNELIYRAYDEETCEIKKSTIDRDEQRHTAITLFSCNPGSYASALAKLNQNEVLFSDAELGDTVSNLYIGDINTGKKKRVEFTNNGGVGIYNIVTTPSSSLVALLSSADGIGSNIRLVDPTSNWKTIWSEDLKNDNISVAWDGEKLTFKNNFGGLTIVNFNKKKEITRLHVPIPNNIYNVSAAKSGVIYTSGSFYSKDISLVDTQTQSQTLITDKFHADSRLGRFYSENFIVFVSNKTGIYQIWLYDIADGVAKQLTKFKQNYRISSLAVSFRLRKIAIQSEGNIRLFSLDEEHRITDEQIEFKGISPEFFRDRIFYTKYNGTIAEIMYRDLNSGYFQEEVSAIEGGFRLKTNGTDIFYSKLYVDGVWQFKGDGEDKLIYESIPSSYPWVIIGKEILFANDTLEHHSYNIETKQLQLFSSDLCKHPIDLVSNKCITPVESLPLTKLVIFEW